MLDISFDGGPRYADSMEEATTGVRRDILESVGRELRERWVQMVEREVSPEIAAIYVEAISEPIIIGDSVSVELNEDHHVVVRTVEHGQRSADLKESLLRSPKAKVSKEGNRYIDVPLVYKDPRMVAQRRVFPSQLLPLFRAAKDPRATIIPRNADHGLARLRKDPPEWKKRHNTPMNRFQGVKFRRVSDKSTSWISQTTSAHNFADRMQHVVAQVVDSAIDKELKRGRLA